MVKIIINDVGKLLATGVYYISVIYFLLFLPYSDTIVSYSDVFLLIFAIGPLIFIFLPNILKRALHVGQLNSIIYSFFIFILFSIITIIVGRLTVNYFKNFSYEKWNNSDYCNLRYMMIESLEKKYSFVGKNKEEVYSILGKIDNQICPHDHKDDTEICYMTYETMMRNDFYCLYLDTDGAVIGTEYKSIR